MPFNDTLEKIGRAIIMERFREPLRLYLLKAGYDTIPYSFYALLFFAALIATAALHFILLIPHLSALGALTAGAATFMFWVVVLSVLLTVAMFFIWSFLNLRIYARTKEMEDRLADYLSLVVTNLKSGMSFDKSLWGAIRPEFGVLAREITIVSKKVMTGNDTTEALKEFADRYDSPILRRSINLIISEIESGGEVAEVINRVIDNLRRTAELKKEMAASVVSYMLFISIIVLVLAPVLFALANTILRVILGFAEQIAASPDSSGGLGGSANNIFSSLESLAEGGEDLLNDFKLFSFVALSTVSMFAGMIVSILENGNIKGGIKYIPVFITITLVVFYFVNKGLEAAFTSLI